MKITRADAANSGYLLNTDWQAFNSKQNTLTFGNVTESGSSVLTITGGTGAVIGGTGLAISVKVANTSQSGYLTSTDWNTFNGKQAALGYTPLNPANNLSEVTAATARTNLGVPGLSTVNTFTNNQVLSSANALYFSTGNAATWTLFREFANQGAALANDAWAFQYNTRTTSGGTDAWSDVFRVAATTGALTVSAAMTTAAVTLGGTLSLNGQIISGSSLGTITVGRPASPTTAIWGLNVQNSGASDSSIFGQAGSAYAGTLAWIGTSNAFIYFNNGQDFRIGSGTGATPAMSIRGASGGSGRVLINTATDNATDQLQVAGSIGQTSSSGIINTIATTGTTAAAGLNAQNDASNWLSVRQFGSASVSTLAGLTLNNWGVLYQNAGNGILINAVAASPIVFATTNLERMRLNGAGRLLIGQTTDNGIDQIQMTGSLLTASLKATSGSVVSLYPQNENWATTNASSWSEWRMTTLAGAAVANDLFAFQYNTRSTAGGADGWVNVFLVSSLTGLLTVPVQTTFTAAQSGSGGAANVKVAGQATFDLWNTTTGGTPTAGSRWRVFADNVGGGGGTITLGFYDLANTRIAGGFDNNGWFNASVGLNVGNAANVNFGSGWTAFTPTYQVPSGTITENNRYEAVYMRIGNLVFVKLNVNLTSSTTINWCNVSLPIANASSATGGGSFNIAWSNNNVWYCTFGYVGSLFATISTTPAYQNFGALNFQVMMTFFYQV
jgi:hypothetical protein